MSLTVALSKAITGYWWAIIAGGIGVMYAFKKWKATPAGQKIWDTFKLRIPPQSPAEMSLGVRFLDSARAPSKKPDGQTQAVVGTVPIEQPK